MIGKMTITEVMPALNSIAKQHGLKLNRLKDFRIARKLLAIRYTYFHGHISQN
tara:strand:+ start:104 stop:262 length:159 start_codon:yes stop_codon:yes gene_type:complete